MAKSKWKSSEYVLKKISSLDKPLRDKLIKDGYSKDGYGVEFRVYKPAREGF